MKEYILTSTIYHTKSELAFYGIALVEGEPGSYELIKSFNDLSERKEDVEALLKKCNEENLSESQLIDVVDDLLSKNKKRA